MLKESKAFSTFAVDDVAKAKQFYGETLGLDVKDEMDGLALQLAGGSSVFIYPKPDYTPATFTVLNFPVDDVEQAVDRLTAAGVTFEHYDGFEPGREGDRARGRGADDRMVHRPGRQHPLGARGRVTELAIRLRGVVKRYGEITAVDGLDLDVPEGTCVGLLGPNGAGKSTTMRLLTAQALPDEGELELLGFELPRRVEAGAGAARRDAAARQPRRHAHGRAEPARLRVPLPDRPGRAARRDPARARAGASSSTGATRASTSSPAACAGGC